MTVKLQTIDGDRTQAQFSLRQLVAIVGAVLTAGFVVGSGLYAIKSDLAIVSSGFREMKQERTENLREWTKWRAEVDRTNTTQDARLQYIERARGGQD